MTAGTSTSKSAQKTRVRIGSLFAQRAQQNWTQLGDKNIKYFQIAVTILKRHKYVWKIMDKHGI